MLCYLIRDSIGCKFSASALIRAAAALLAAATCLIHQATRHMHHTTVAMYSTTCMPRYVMYRLLF
jgi:hypothetical protein